MKRHNIATARYAKPDNTHYFVAVTDSGVEISTNVQSDVEGGMVAFLAEGGVVAAYVEPEVNLLDLKAQYSARVDTDAENYRLIFITPGAGMAMTYREKYDQAIAANSAGKATIDAMTTSQGIEAYPTLMASVGLEAPTLWDVAQLVLAKHKQWGQLSFIIEKKRLSGKAAIEAAETPSAVMVAYEAVKWS